MVEDGALTDRQRITLWSRARVDADQVLAARTGEATLIAGGGAGRGHPYGRRGRNAFAGPVRSYPQVDFCTPWRPLVQTPQQLTYHRLQLLVGLLLLAISLGGLVLLLALFT